MAKFDLEAARAAGYTDEEIREFLLSQKGVAEAREAGYSDEDILAHFGFGVAPPVEQWDGPFRLVDLAGQGLFQGAASTIGLPGTLLEMAKETWPGTPLDALALPTMEDTTNFTNELGLTGNPELVAQNPLEKYVEAGAAGLGSSLGLGGPLGLATSITSGLGAQAGADLLPDSIVGPITGGLIGGLGFGGVAAAIKKGLSAKSVTKEVAEARKALDEIKMERMPEKRAALVEAATKKLAGAKAALAGVRDKIVSQADQEFARVADTLGSSKTLQEAGTKLQEEARKWLGTTLPKKLEGIWAPVDKAIPGETPVTLSAFEAVLDNINKSAGALEPLAGQMKPKLPASLKKTFDALKDLQESGDVADFSWSEVQKLRTTLGDALSDPMVIKDIGAQNLDALYAALSQDMRTAAKSVGAEELFNVANTSSKALYEVAEGPVAKVISGVKPSANDPTPEAVAKSFLNSGKTGATELAILRAEMPKGVDELGSVYLRSGGWGKLAPETQAIFVPDEALRTGVSAQWGAREGAKKSFGEASSEAAKQHAEEVQKAKFASDQRLFEANRRLQQAKEKEALLPKKSSISQTLDSVTNLPSMISGGSLAVLGGHLMSQPDHILNAAIGTTAGLVAPTVAKGAKAVIRDPKLLGIPARGALAGNALLPEEP